MHKETFCSENTNGYEIKVKRFGLSSGTNSIEAIKLKHLLGQNKTKSVFRATIVR